MPTLNTINASGSPKAYRNIINQGRREYQKFVEKKFKAVQIKSKNADFDLGNVDELVDLALKSPALQAYLELNKKFQPKKFVGLNNDTGIGPGTKKTPPGMLTLSNSEIEEVNFSSILDRRKPVKNEDGSISYPFFNINKVLESYNMETMKLVLIRSKQGDKSIYTLQYHGTSGDDKKEVRESELKVIQEVVNALGVNVHLYGDFQDSPFESGANKITGKEELHYDANGNLIYSKQFKDALDHPDGLGALHINHIIPQNVIIEKTRGDIENDKFMGCNFAVCEQGEKPDLVNFSTGMMIMEVEPRKAGDAKNSDLIPNLPKLTKADVLNFNENPEAKFLDHGTATKESKDDGITIMSGACMSQSPPKNFKDITRYYKPNAFEDGQLKREVRDLEVAYTEKFYKLAILNCAKIKLTNPDVIPLRDEKGEVITKIKGKPITPKTNAQHLSDFHKALMEFGIKNPEEIKPEDLDKLNFKNSQKMRKLHMALDKFLSTQARGNNDKAKETDFNKCESFDPETIPPEGNDKTYNPELTKALHATIKEYLKSEEFEKGYHTYVRDPKHPTKDKITDAHVQKVVAGINKVSRGGSGRSVCNYTAELIHGLQGNGGFPKISGSTTESRNSIERNQRCELSLRMSDVMVCGSNNQIYQLGITEASEAECPREKGDDSAALSRVELYSRSIDACNDYYMKASLRLEERLKETAANDNGAPPKSPMKELGHFGSRSPRQSTQPAPDEKEKPQVLSM